VAKGVIDNPPQFLAVVNSGASSADFPKHARFGVRFATEAESKDNVWKFDPLDTDIFRIELLTNPIPTTPPPLVPYPNGCGDTLTITQQDLLAGRVMGQFNMALFFGNQSPGIGLGQLTWHITDPQASQAFLDIYQDNYVLAWNDN